MAGQLRNHGKIVEYEGDKLVIDPSAMIAEQPYLIPIYEEWLWVVKKENGNLDFYHLPDFGLLNRPHSLTVPIKRPPLVLAAFQYWRHPSCARHYRPPRDELQKRWVSLAFSGTVAPPRQ